MALAKRVVLDSSTKPACGAAETTHALRILLGDRAAILWEFSFVIFNPPVAGEIPGRIHLVMILVTMVHRFLCGFCFLNFQRH